MRVITAGSSILAITLSAGRRAREIDARVGHQGGEPGDKVERLKHHVRCHLGSASSSGNE